MDLVGYTMNSFSLGIDKHEVYLVYWLVSFYIGFSRNLVS